MSSSDVTPCDCNQASLRMESSCASCSAILLTISIAVAIAAFGNALLTQ